MHFGVLGDIHGDFASVHTILTRHPDIPFWLCVGDVGGDEGHYEDPPAPVYWIKGNNEDFEFVGRRASDAALPNLRYVPNGIAAEVEGIRVAGLGGTFAPTWYETPPGELPFPTSQGAAPRSASLIAKDKRRHFVRDEVDACARLENIDVFLSHEAARPFFVGTGARRMDAGKTPVNEVLAAMKPRVHFFGHHHRFSDEVRQGVRSLCLDLVSRSYVLVDAGAMDITKLET